jgi:hypothetical protein
MLAFQQALAFGDLSDLEYKGPKHTWSNCREGMECIKENLDRGVANQEWREFFPEVIVSVEAAVSSDIAPLFLNLLGLNHGGVYKASFVWRSIQSTCDLIREGSVWRIGNGKNARIWEDRWLLTHSTFRVQSARALLDPMATVEQLIDEDLKCWKKPLLDQLFSPDEAKTILSIPINCTDQEDIQIRRGNEKGVFTVIRS